MMKIRLVCIGKLKERYYIQLQAEYAKMMTRYCNVDLVELPDEPLDRAKSEKQVEAVRVLEGQRALQKAAGYIIACDMRGKKFTSEGFSQALEGIMQKDSVITFIIGGSAGLSQEVRDAANLILSFSDMTLPHRLFRIVLMEQVYRACKIMRGETYHK